MVLFSKGLVYIEVPIDASDHISVPPLEGFVMNRVLGDYFETLLYKIFVSVDEKTSVGEVPPSFFYFPLRFPFYKDKFFPSWQMFYKLA